MGFGEAVTTCLRKYATASGRATRAEYWWFYLFGVVLAVGATVIDAILGTAVLGAFVALALIIPTVAAGIRRLHDRGHSGWMLLVAFIPFGIFVVVVLLALQGRPGENKYGPEPRTAIPGGLVQTADDI